MNFLLRYPRTFAAIVFAGGFIRSAWMTAYPDQADHQAVLDSRYQPLATLIGGAVPSTILAVVAYFVLAGLAKRPAPAGPTAVAPVAIAPRPAAAPALPSELDRALDAIDRLGMLMETYPSAILDESALQVPKARMKVLLRVAMAAFRGDPERVEILRTAWLMLGSFQPGIGPTPLVPPTFAKGRVATPAELAAFERYHQLFSAATAEGQLNLREGDLYLKSLEG